MQWNSYCGMGTLLEIVSPLPFCLHIEKDKNEGDEIVVNIDVNTEVKNDKSGFQKCILRVESPWKRRTF